MRISSRSLLPLLLVVIALAGGAAIRRPPAAAARPALVPPAQAGCAPTCTVLMPQVNSPLPGPFLHLPADQAQIDSIAPTLAWYPAIHGTKYVIQVATSPDFLGNTVEVSTTKTLKEGATELQSTIPRNNLNGATTYYWRVGVRLPTGTDYSPTAQFTTAAEDAARLPAVPALLSPANAARITTTSPTLVWSAAPGIDAYRVRFVLADYTSPDTSGILEAPQTQYQLKDLLRNTIYRWQIKAHSSYGWSEYGPYFYFRTP